MSVGENILKLRKQKGLSQEQLGEKVNVSRQTISNWELNETLPDTNQLILLSKTLNVSIDDLVNNDIKGVIVEKISNTEKLAGLVIKILKVIGILLIIFVIINIIMLILFTCFRKESTNTDNKSVILNCSIENEQYQITIGDDNYFNCPNCSKEMNVYLKDVTDWANLDHSVENVKKYFNDNGGNCNS